MISIGWSEYSSSFHAGQLNFLPYYLCCSWLVRAHKPEKYVATFYTVMCYQSAGECDI